MSTRYSKRIIGLAAAVALTAVAGCEHIHDPWVTGNQYFAEERQRSPEQQKVLRERALLQVGPVGAAEANDYETSRFIEK